MNWAVLNRHSLAAVWFGMMYTSKKRFFLKSAFLWAWYEMPLLAWDRSHQTVAPVTLCTLCVRVRVMKGNSSLQFLAQQSVFCKFVCSEGEKQAQYGFTGLPVVVLSLCNGSREACRLKWKCELSWAWNRKSAEEECRIRKNFKGEWRVSNTLLSMAFLSLGEPLHHGLVTQLGKLS